MHRRRFIKIAATHLTGLSLASGCLRAATQAKLQKVEWRGIVLGADASLQLYTLDPQKTKQLLQQCHQLIRKLEGMFSLYQAESTISRLNKNGRLSHAPVDFIQLLEMALQIGTHTNGAFDITVHPLVELYRNHFAQTNPDPSGPTEMEIAATLKRVNYRAIEIKAQEVRFRQPDMQITLNGIAQGYITDRVSAFLKSHGFERTLVQMGENRALGCHPDGTPWQIGIVDAQRAIQKVVELNDAALATSGSYGTVFEASGHVHHLINPRSGKCAQGRNTVSVIAPNATTADALSTALAVTSSEQTSAILRHYPDCKAI